MLRWTPCHHHGPYIVIAFWSPGARTVSFPVRLRRSNLMADALCRDPEEMGSLS